MSAVHILSSTDCLQNIINSPITVVKQSGLPVSMMVAIGTAGCFVLKNLHKEMLPCRSFLSVHSDRQHLQRMAIDHSLLIGENSLPRPLGNADPAWGKQAAVDSETALLQEFTGKDVVFILAGLGGSTGTGAAPEVARAARASGARVVAMVSLPLPKERKRRSECALAGLDELAAIADVTVVIPLAVVLPFAPPTTARVTDFFEAVDLQMGNVIIRLVSIVLSHGSSVEEGFQALRNFLSHHGAAFDVPSSFK